VFCANALKFARLMNGTTTTGDEPSDVYDAGNRRHVERRQMSAKVERQQLDEALRWLMSDIRGRRVVWELLGKAGVFRSSMAPSPETTAFNEGRRDLGLGLLADVTRLCPDQYGRMQAEAHAMPKRVTETASTGEIDGQ
jgi:hypothetical protein